MKEDLDSLAARIVQRLLEAAPNERPELKCVLCGDNQSLRRQVEWRLSQQDVDTLLEGSSASDGGGARSLPEVSGRSTEGGADGQPGNASASYESTLDEPAGLSGGKVSGSPKAPSPVMRHPDGPVAGRFVPTEILGRGGQGEVWKALDPELNRFVALKVVKSRLRGSTPTLAKLKHEAEVTGKLEHPNIVPIYEAGRETPTDSGQSLPYYVMKVLGHQNLRQAIEALHRNWDEVALKKLVRRLIDVCEALAFAHDRAVIHRDLKPENIMLGAYGETLVVDWGLAKVLGVDSPSDVANAMAEPLSVSEALDPTQTGSVMGTLGYMSPEQARGEIRQLTAATDIYGLGGILYCLLANRAPHSSPAIGVGVWAFAKKLGNNEIQWPSPREVHAQTPRALEAICLKAMSFDPDRRYQNALQMAADLSNWLDDQPVSAWIEPLSVRARRAVRRHQTFVASTGAATLVASIVLLAMYVVVSGKNADITGINESLKATNQQLAESRLQETKQKDVALANEKQAVESERLARQEQAKAEIARREAQASEQAAIASAAEARRQKEIAARQAVAASMSFGEQALERDDLLTAHLAFARSYQVANESLKLKPEELEEFSLRQGLTEALAPQLTGLLFAESAVHAARFSPDGKLIALMHRSNGTVRLWNPATSQPVSVPFKHAGPLVDIAFSPDSQRLYSAASFGGRSTLYCWDVATGNEIAKVAVPGRCRMLAINRAGTRIVTGALVMGLLGGGGEVQFYDSRVLEKIGQPVSVPGGVNALAFSPNDELLAIGTLGTKTSVVIIKAADQTRVTEVESLGGHPPTSLDFDPAGSKLAIGTNTGIAAIADAQTGKKLFPELKRMSEVQSAQPDTPEVLNDGGADDSYGRSLGFVKFSPDGSLLLTASGDRTAQLWEATTGTAVGRQMEHRDHVSEIQFNSDGSRLLTGSLDGTVRLWDGRSGRQAGSPLPHSGRVLSAAFSPDGRSVVSAGEDQTARIWKPYYNSPVRPDPTVKAVSRQIISGDSQWLAQITRDGDCRVFNTLTHEPAGPAFKLNHAVHASSIASAARRIALSGVNPEGQSWLSIVDFTTGQTVDEPTKLDGLPISIGLEPKGRWCSIIAATRGVARLAVRNITAHQTLPVEIADPFIAIWHPTEDSRLYVAPRDGIVRSVQFPEGLIAPTVARDPGKTFRQLSFNAKGDLLIGVTDNTISVWSPEKQARVVQPITPSPTIEPNGAALTADGLRMLTWDMGGSVRLWSRIEAPNQWTEVGQILLAGPVDAAVFSPNERHFVTACRDGTARLWNATTLEAVSPPWRHATATLDPLEVRRIQFHPEGRLVFSSTSSLTQMVANIGAKSFDAAFAGSANPRSGDVLLRMLPDAATQDVFRWDLKSAAEKPELLVELAEFTMARRLENNRLKPITRADLEDYLPMLETRFPQQAAGRQQAARRAIEREDFATAGRHLLKATQIAPQDGLLWFEYGKVLRELSEHRDAELAATKALENKLSDSKVWLLRGRIRMSLGTFDTAIADLKQCISTSLVPCFAELDLATCQGMLGQWDEAANTFDKSFAGHQQIGEPVEVFDRYRRLVVELGRGKPDEFRRLTRALLKEKSQETNAGDAGNVVLPCILLPDAVEDWEPVIKLGELLVKQPRVPLEHRTRYGAALFRAGRLKAAEEQLRLALAEQTPLKPDEVAPSAWPHLYMALILKAQGQAAEAQQQFELGSACLSAGLNGPVRVPLVERMPWQRRIALELLQKEYTGK